MGNEDTLVELMMDDDGAGAEESPNEAGALFAVVCDDATPKAVVAFGIGLTDDTNPTETAQLWQQWAAGFASRASDSEPPPPPPPPSQHPPPPSGPRQPRYPPPPQPSSSAQPWQTPPTSPSSHGRWRKAHLWDALVVQSWSSTDWQDPDAWGRWRMRVMWPCTLFMLLRRACVEQMR